MEMAATTEMFDSYKIFYYTDRPFAPYQAMIECYRGSQYVGRIIFYPDGDVPMSGEASLHYPFSRFDDVVTMLRYEKPLYLWWDSYPEGGEEVIFGMISTSEQEPTGEQEP
jgi:hypothetical protein